MPAQTSGLLQDICYIFVLYTEKYGELLLSFTLKSVWKSYSGPVFKQVLKI